MAAAEVGDDVYGEDPTVNALEAEVAALFGHEAALFAPTGSMANQIALQLLVPPGDELLCDADAHVVTYEIGAAAAIGGISTRTWPSVGGDLDVDLVASMIRPDGYHAVPTRAIAVEQTHNRGGGAVIPLTTLRRLRAVTDGGRRGAALRRRPDLARARRRRGAAGRVRRAVRHAVGLPVQGARRAGRLAGDRRTSGTIDRARMIRKRMGGGMRQVGILAAAGRYALEHHMARLADDHARARGWPRRWRRSAWWTGPGTHQPRAARPRQVHCGRAALAAAAAERGVLVSVLGPRIARLVTHLDLDDDDVDRAVEVLPAVFARANS